MPAQDNLSERTPLRETPEGAFDGVDEERKTSASPKWVVIPYFVFSLLQGAASSVDAEIMTQISCRMVESENSSALPGFPSSSHEGHGGWAEACRASPAVQARTTKNITSVILVVGILSTLTAAWWGGLADRRGRKPVLALVSLSEVATAAATFLPVLFPGVFGIRFFLAGAVLYGLTGGQLSGTTTAVAYLGDCARGGSKTELLTLFEATQFLGAGIGPMLTPVLLPLGGLAAPHITILLCRLVFLVVLLFLPESMPLKALRRMQQKAAAEAAQTKPFLARLAEVPAELVRPLKVLLPKADEYGKKDWRLTLVAIAFALFLVVPGLGSIKVLYVRGKFDWGVEEVGRWMSFNALCKLVVLLGILPLYNRLRKKQPTALEDNDAKQLKKEADTAFDLSVARHSVLLALFGYLAMSFPTSSSRNFIVGTAFTSFAAATTPTLESLALAFCAPEDAGKVLASMATLATVSLSTVGPSLFGAVYVAFVERWPEVVFVLAAAWIGCSLLSLLLVRVESSGRRGEEQEA
ncbi:hypothetical protein JCM10213_006337 [Rhodosporidiobolus nylandii]